MLGDFRQLNILALAMTYYFEFISAKATFYVYLLAPSIYARVNGQSLKLFFVRF